MQSALQNADIFGFAAAILSTVAFIPQVVKTWRTKSAGDVSFTLLITFSTGCLNWVIYGILVNSKPVTIANTITLMLNLAILALKVKFQGKNIDESVKSSQQ